MKKRFFCLLALFLCVTLCACGGNDAGSGNAGGSNTDGGNEDGGTQAPVICEGSFTPDANWELMQYFYGDWQRVEASPIWNIETVSIRKDGTCMVNDQEYQLTFCKDSTEDRVVFHAHRDGKTEFLFHVTKAYNNPNYDVVMGFGYYYDHDAVQFMQDIYWNPAQVQEVQITPDNWQEYFEVKDTVVVNKNAFGEITSTKILQQLILKEAYRLSVIAEQDLVIELAQTPVTATAQVDLDNLTFSLGEVLREDNRRSSIKEFRGRQTDFSLWLGEAWYIMGNGEVQGYFTNPEVLRSMGSLYLLK